MPFLIGLFGIMSEKISAKLDEEDFIQSEYFLEVCSPGAERELKTYEQIKDAIGEFVYVKLKDPKAGMCDVKGTLLSCEENSILRCCRMKKTWR